MSTVEKTGFISCKALVRSLLDDMIAGGFTLAHPASLVADTSAATLHAGPTVNALDAEQPWRVRIDATDDFQIRMNVATPTQLSNTGTLAKVSQQDSKGATAQTIDTAGCLGNDGLLSSPQMAYEDLFFTRHSGAAAQSDLTGIRDLETAASYPMSYRLTCTDRGFALFIWTQATDELATKFSWVVVQRPVDHLTGAVLLTGKAPVFCVYSSGNLIRKFVVREADISKPTLSVSAVANTPDSAAIINSAQQVAINEQSRYVIRFPFGLNTQRYAYTHELDLIGYTSADVVSEYSEVPLRPYGETTDRIYKAMKSNGPNNTGMRVLFLTSGPGV